MQLPKALYVRLQQTAQATRQSLEATLLRVLQVGSPPAWETAPAEFQADLDCNQYGDYSDAGDVVVIYYGGVGGGRSIECQGNNWPGCSSGDRNAATTGEEIAGTPYNYEWLADVNTGTVNWSQCLGTVNIRFITRNIGDAVEDPAAVGEYDVPTVVTLENFAAGQHNTSFSLAVASLLVGVITVAIFSFVRRRSS